MKTVNVKVDGINLNASHFGSMSKEKAVEQMKKDHISDDPVWAGKAWQAAINALADDKAKTENLEREKIEKLEKEKTEKPVEKPIPFLRPAEAKTVFPSEIHDEQKPIVSNEPQEGTPKIRK